MLPPLDRGSVQTIASTGQSFEVVLQCIGASYTFACLGCSNAADSKLVRDTPVQLSVSEMQ